MSRKPQIAIMGIVLLSLFASPALSGEPAGTAGGTTLDSILEAPLDAATQKRLARILTKLGSDTFATREKAQSDLQHLAALHPDAVLDQTLDTYLDAVDPEVRYRLRSAMFNAVAATISRPGFIGIQMSMRAMVLNRAQQIEPPNFVEVEAVIPDSAAKKFGVRDGDHIIELDGKPFDVTPGMPSPAQQLKAYVSQRDEGTPLKLTIVRGAEKIQIDLALGGLPDSLNPGVRERMFEDWMYDELVERHLAMPRPDPEPQRHPRQSPHLPDDFRQLPRILPGGLEIVPNE